MNRLTTVRSTTALAPWLVLFVVVGSSSRDAEAPPRHVSHGPGEVVLCQATEPVVATPARPRVAMFGPPPTGRPAISAKPVNRQLFKELPILPGPHANARAKPPADEKVRIDVDDATALKDVEEVWGKIVLDELPLEQGTRRENCTAGRTDAPFPTIDRPLGDTYDYDDPDLGFGDRLETRSNDIPERPSDSLSSAPEIRRLAPWFDRDKSLPGPHRFAHADEEPTTKGSVPAPAEPPIVERSDEYREAPTVPLPSTKTAVPGDREGAPRVSAFPDVAAAEKHAPFEPGNETIAPPRASASPRTSRFDERPQPRDSELEIVASNADIHTQRAFELAGKQAYFTARTEFIKSLRMLSEALDVHYQTQLHGRALAAGLLALEEADEFIPRGDHLEAEIDVPMIVSGHSTPVLKDTGDRSIGSLEARQRYYTYAQQQLAQSIENEVAGSMALYGLGKLYTVLGEQRRVSIQAAQSKAVVFHQAALMADPNNALAANEMGVLLARYGRLKASRELLLYSLRVAPLPATWHNLSVVHARLGERELAQLAQEEYVNAVREAQSRRAHAAPGDARFTSPVRWVAPEELARSSARERIAQVPTDIRPPQNTPPTSTDRQRQHQAGSSWWSRLPRMKHK